MLHLAKQYNTFSKMLIYEKDRINRYYIKRMDTNIDLDKYFADRKTFLNLFCLIHFCDEFKKL